MKRLNWLHKMSGKALLKKEMAKNGVPKERISSGLINELFERVENTCMGLSLVSDDLMMNMMVEHVENTARHVAMIYSGGGMGKALDDDLLPILKRHGLM